MRFPKQPLGFGLAILAALGCAQGDGAPPLEDGLYLQAHRGESIHLVHVAGGQPARVAGTFERVSITNAKSLFRITTQECGVFEFILKPGDQVECASCSAGIDPALAASCPLTSTALAGGWTYLSR